MSSSQPERSAHVPEVLSAPHLWASLRARWPLLLLGPVLGALFGCALATVLPTQYNAVATVRTGAGIVPLSTVGQGSDGALTESQLAMLQPQLETVGDELGVSASSVKTHLNVAPRSGTPLIDFTFSASTARKAERGAEVASGVYLRASTNSATEQIQERIDLLQEDLATATETERPDLLRDLSTLERTVVDRGTLVRDPAGSAERSVLVPPLYPAIGAAGGLVLAALLAFLLEGWRPRIRRGTRLSGMPVLGHFTAGMDPQDARGMLMPALVRGGGSGLVLAPLGLQADSLAELFSRSIAGVSWVDPLEGDSLGLTPPNAQLVALVRTGTPIRELRALASRLALAEIPLLGVVVADAQALAMAERLLDEQHRASVWMSA